MLPGPWTPTLHEEIVRLATWMPFGRAVTLTEVFRQVALSEPTVRRRTEAAGAACVLAEQAEVTRLEREQPVPPPGPAVQQVSVDGAMVPLRHGEWAEVKTLAVGTVTQAATGEIQTTELSYFSRLADHERFTREALGELHQRGTERAGRVCFIVDGAEWEQKFIEFHHPQAVRILDWGHAAEYVSRAGQAAFGAGTGAASEWIAQQWHELRHGEPQLVLAELRRLQATLAAAGNAGALAVVTTSLEYLEKRQDQIRYAEFVALGYPIGSGAVESANKLVVEARLKGSGMHWAREQGDPLVALRAVVCSDRWDERWPCIVAVLREQHRLRMRARRQARQADRPEAPTSADGSLAVGEATGVVAVVEAIEEVSASPSAAGEGVAASAVVSRPTEKWRPAPDHPWRKPLFPRRSTAPARLLDSVEK